MQVGRIVRTLEDARRVIASDSGRLEIAHKDRGRQRKSHLLGNEAGA